MKTALKDKQSKIYWSTKKKWIVSTSGLYIFRKKLWMIMKYEIRRKLRIIVNPFQSKVKEESNIE